MWMSKDVLRHPSRPSEGNTKAGFLAVEVDFLAELQGPFFLTVYLVAHLVGKVLYGRQVIATAGRAPSATNRVLLSTGGLIC